MLKMLKGYFKVNIKELFTIWLAAIGGALFGILLGVLIGVVVAHENYATMGTVMALIFGTISLFFGVALGGQADFKLAVSMNRKRTHYVVARYLLSVIEIGSSLLFITYLQKFEIFLGSVFAPGTETEVFGTLSLQLKLILTFVLPIIIMFLAIMYVKFDKKFFWVMWAVYMLVALGAPRIGTAMKNSPESAAAKIGFFLQNAIDYSSVQFLIVSVVVALILAIANHLLYSKTQVDL